MSKIFHGKVHGRTIEIEEEIGIEDGEIVEVTVKRTHISPSWGNGIRRSAGAATDIVEYDEVFARIQQERGTAIFREATP